MGGWRTVLFMDLDATIIRGPFESVVFPAVFGELARKTGLEPAALRRLAIQENRDRLSDPGVPPALAMDWDDIFAAVAARLGVRLEADAAELVRDHAKPPHATLIAGAADMLAQIARPDRALVIATRGLRKYQAPVLEGLGLAPLCADLLTPDRYGAAKGQAAYYGPWPAAAQVRIGLGDLYEDDVLAPKRLGFKAVWVRHGPGGELGGTPPLARPAAFAFSAEQPERPDAIVFSLEEVPDVITALEGECS